MFCFMRKSLLGLVSLFFIVPLAYSELGWTHYAVEGEDASSFTKYFYKSDGEFVVHVRSVWNGGAQNPPEVTDYILDGSNIKVRHSKGTRGVVEDLVAGRAVKLTVEKEYVIEGKDSESMLIPPAPDKHLTAAQRLDLSNLIYMLALERKAIGK